MKFHCAARVSIATFIVALACFGATGWAQDPDTVPKPLRVVAHVLELSEAQLAGLVELRTGIQADAEALARQMRGLEGRFEEELAREDPSIPLVGELAVGIARTRRSMVELRFHFVESFAGLLEEGQRDRLQQVRGAFQLRAVLPAFKEVGLLP